VRIRRVLLANQPLAIHGRITRYDPDAFRFVSHRRSSASARRGWHVGGSSRFKDRQPICRITLFTYHRALNGLITELYAQLGIMNEELGHFEPRPWHRDRPQRPKVWESGPDPMNWFGILPSEEIRK
jgi:hypothetical protein